MVEIVSMIAVEAALTTATATVAASTIVAASMTATAIGDLSFQFIYHFIIY